MELSVDISPSRMILRTATDGLNLSSLNNLFDESISSDDEQNLIDSELIVIHEPIHQCKCDPKHVDLRKATNCLPLLK